MDIFAIYEPEALFTLSWPLELLKQTFFVNDTEGCVASLLSVTMYLEMALVDLHHLELKHLITVSLRSILHVVTHAIL